MQIHSFITSVTKLHYSGFFLFRLWAIQNSNTRKRITSYYKALSIPVPIRSLWEADFGETIPDNELDNVWSSSSGCSFNNKARELQFRVVHRLQITLLKCNTFNPLLSSVKSLEVHISTVFLTALLLRTSGTKCVKKSALY